jgi:hypothetical protein
MVLSLTAAPQILWKVDGDYDAINADIMDWQQLKTIITDRFVPTKAVAPMVEHLILPMQEVSHTADGDDPVRRKSGSGSNSSKADAVAHTALCQQCVSTQRCPCKR